MNSSFTTRTVKFGPEAYVDGVYHITLCYAGKPHIIKEENFLLFGVVEEKAFKAKSQIITFDFWSVRRNVLQDHEYNAAVVLQNTWRTHIERKRRNLRRSRSSFHGSKATKQGTQVSRVQPQFYKHEIKGPVLDQGSGSGDELPAASSSLNSTGLDTRLDSLVFSAAAAME